MALFLRSLDGPALGWRRGPERTGRNRYRHAGWELRMARLGRNSVYGAGAGAVLGAGLYWADHGVCEREQWALLRHGRLRLSRYARQSSLRCVYLRRFLLRRNLHVQGRHADRPARHDTTDLL